MKNLHDRGMLKWRGFMMPEHMALISEIDFDGHRQAKPILDEYQIAEMESRIHFAQESKIPVSMTVHIGGFADILVGRIVKTDPITKEVRLKVGEMVERIRWADLVGVEIVDD
ncbi:YolD-like family protein [Heyndrickxia sporothermodurans]|uniref:YolD-like family protein n=1 Tax=Heyndrickxia sporothermodurans TaxID=46224 RepID=UPI002E1B427A|nr:YolD-like family protein [Heyndrickxia sporothermodurans]MED3697921.1 YolD-like family protein [Heyndrickxia sporothermodurans]